MNDPQAEGHMASHIERRKFLATLGGAAAWPLAARAQQGERMRRISVMMAYDESDPEAQARIGAVRQGLPELGWTEGHNLRMEIRWGTGDPDRARTSTTELISLAPHVIVAHGTPALGALHRATRRIRLGHRPSRCRLPAESGFTGRQHYR